jgi:archaellum component FlaD/FlaE
MKTPPSIDKITAALCESFAAAADALSRRRAGEIPESAIEKFVALRWLEWCGGTLRLTELGQIVLMKVQSRMVSAAPAI